MEVRRARRECAKRRSLEATEITPEPCDVAAARIGQLADIASRSVAEGVQGQLGVRAAADAVWMSNIAALMLVPLFAELWQGVGGWT